MAIDIPSYGPYDLADLFGDWWQGYNPLIGFPAPTYRDNMKRGESLPQYLDEYQLKLLRDRSRALCGTNEFAICAIDNRKFYCVGTGFKLRAVAAKKEYAEDECIAETQEVLDLLCEVNDLAERETESVERLDVDGETFVRLFPREDGITVLRFVEPELVKSPGTNYDSAYSFGIQTDPEDVETVVGYWVVDDPMERNTPKFVDEKYIVHMKLNSRSTAKRGVPTFYPIEQNLKRAESLLANMSAMAKTRAAIAMIRSFKGSPRASIANLTQGATEVSVTDPNTQTTLNVERMRPGTILNSSGTIEYEFPHASVAASEFVEVLQAELRACAARMNMPEWMFSADASNSSYSSSFVAESSAVKMFTHLQDLLRRKWGEGRFGQKKSIIWRCIENAIDAKILSPDVREKVRIICDTPSLLARDQDREASMNKVYLDMRVKSRQTIQQELGLDSEQEDKNFKEDELLQQATEEQPIQGQKAIQTGDAQPRLAVARNYGVAESLAIPDIRQADGMSCGPACALAVGLFFEKGPATLDEWKSTLKTTEDGTHPEAIAEAFVNLGLYAESSEMTLDQLREHIREQRPVICPIQSGGVGHYVVVLGEALGNFVIHDPDSGSRLIPESEWLANWHDETESRSYKNYGIAVSRGDWMNGRLLKELMAKVDALATRAYPENLVPAQPPVTVNQNPEIDYAAFGKAIAENLPKPEPIVFSPTIQVPEQPPAVVNVAPQVVNVEAPVVNVPQQPAPVVNAPVTVQSAPAQVTVVPSEPSPRRLSVTRDKKTGKIDGAEIE